MSKYKTPSISSTDIKKILLKGIADSLCILSDGCGDMNCADCLFDTDSTDDTKDELIQYLVKESIIDNSLAMQLTLEHTDE